MNRATQAPTADARHCHACRAGGGRIAGCEAEHCQTQRRQAPAAALPEPKGELAGRVALLVGCDALTHTAADLLIAAGADVVVASPCPAQRAGFNVHPRLHVWPICLATDHGAQQARRRIARQFGRLDLVVAALGTWPPPDRVVAPVRFRAQRVLDPDMDAHYSLARTLLPLMAEQGGAQFGGAQYLLINDTNLAGAGATARLQLKDALATEARGLRVGVHSVVVRRDPSAAAAASADLIPNAVAALIMRLMRDPAHVSRTFRLGDHVQSPRLALRPTQDARAWRSVATAA